MKTCKRQPNNINFYFNEKTKPKRQVLPDPIRMQGNKLLTTMYDGKKSLSYNIFYTALDAKVKLPNYEKSASKYGKC